MLIFVRACSVAAGRWRLTERVPVAPSTAAFFFKSVKELAFCSEAANYRKWKQRSRLWTAFNFLPRCSPNGKREQDTFGLSLLKKITLLWRSFWLFFLNAAGVLGRFLTHVWCTSIALTIYCWDSSIRAADKLLSCQLSMCAFILKKSKGLLVIHCVCTWIIYQNKPFDLTINLHAVRGLFCLFSWRACWFMSQSV